MNESVVSWYHKAIGLSLVFILYERIKYMLEHLQQYSGTYSIVVLYFLILLGFMRFGKFMKDTDEQMKHWTEDEKK